ncbi:MAG: energy transducer TonB [Armatimonadota bacterium]
MRSSDFLLPFLVSAGIHVGLLAQGLSSHEAPAAPPDEAACVVLNLVPPPADRAPDASADPMSPPPPPAQATESRKPPTPSAPINEGSPDLSEKPEREEAPRRADRSPLPVPTQVASGPLPDVGSPLVSPGAPPGRLGAAAGPSAASLGPPGRRMSSASLVAGGARRPPMSLPEPEPSSPPTPALQPEAGDNSQASGNPEGDIEGEGGAVAARVLGVSKPKYPGLSRRRNEQGRVVLAVEIRADGTHGGIQIVHSSGHSRLDQAAVQALKRGKFVPAKRNGEPVTSTKQIAFTFRLVDAGR